MSKYLTTDELIALNSKADELKDNFDNMDKTNSILNEMLSILGEEPMFKTTEDFIKFMESDKPLIF